ncbi:tRNA (adenosine(37)-N6)-threonylcarbamoyltransferase complex dimerization subunit type 1 TsaB [Francisella halioticida]|uniref:tRNA threonylcarbamoyladenosine biosynthesis protein TsaB n=1 Tax=Francisella halioticida TaxID=549298 RepID=A0ABM6LYS1_9GAMM|nr:tRNA (adenosine(37)-N6)-threonylcarbamoyltransferase complex dimerization subunit type 1 TsaB [Francisella halioticida]ASG67826.1 tRNA (adenosine(37)-N6)-threonylcarbamoyltransferase complex dimerization subunit type 1 TsaB [Francisella halioticida]
MNFLVLDTSSRYCSVVLSVAGKVYNDTREIPRQHNKYLLKMVRSVFEKADVDKKALDFIAYGIGPGSFVGVRLAAAVCQGFAVGLDIPIIGFSSMFAIAKSTEINSENIAVILDARMGDFYLGLYNVNKDEIVSEDVYKLEDYSKSLYLGYSLVGDCIYELNVENYDFKLDVGNVVDYVFRLYVEQRSQVKLTQEVFPVYLRGTSHWKTKE